MSAEELRQLLDQLDRKNNNVLLISADEKIPAADLDATAKSAQNVAPSKHAPKSNGGDDMAKWTAQELDGHRSQNRMRVRKVPEVPKGALTLVTPTTPVAVPQAVTSTASETAPVDLVQLKRDIKEWTALHLILNSPDRYLAKGQMKTKLIAFVLYYLMAALLVGIIWAAAGH